MKRTALLTTLAVLLTSCAVLTASPNCNFGPRFRWELANQGPPAETITIDAVSLSPDASGGNGPHDWVDISIDPGGTLTHPDYATPTTPNYTETLDVTFHWSGTPTTPRTVSQTQTENCP